MSAIDRLVVERGATRAKGDLLDHEPLPAGDGPSLSELVEQGRKERL